MKQQLKDYGVVDSNTTIKCDNISAINLTKNPILHSQAKHIEIKHHFICDHVNNGEVNIQFVDSQNQLAYIFTKSLDKKAFDFIRIKLVIINPFVSSI